MIFRFDDVSKNSGWELHSKMTGFIQNKFPGCLIIWAISPLIVWCCGQRAYPRIWNARSDIRTFFKVDDAYVPVPVPGIRMASHGLIHADHRLLSYGAQEMSILVSCSLVKTSCFVPPFNKWNKDTETICRENGIELIKFEDGWKCMEYNTFDPMHDKWYLHAREWTVDTFCNYFK